MLVAVFNEHATDRNRAVNEAATRGSKDPTMTTKYLLRVGSKERIRAANEAAPAGSTDYENAPFITCGQTADL